MENWTSVKSADEAAPQEVVQETAPQEVEQTPEEPQGYQTPVNDDGDYQVNLDAPIGDVEETSVEPPEQLVEEPTPVEETSVEPTPDAPVEEFGIELVTDDEPVVESKPEPEPVAIHEEPAIELPEGVDKLVNFMQETGGTVEDYLDLNRDVSQMHDVDVLREYYRKTKPHFNNDDIDFHMNKQFLYDQEVDDPGDIRAKQLAFKEELYKAQNHLTSQKEKYYADLKLNPKHATPEVKEAVEFYDNHQKREEESKKLVTDFHAKTDTLFNDEFKGFDFNVGDKKFRVKVGDVGKTKEFQKDINNWINGFIGDDQSVKDVREYHKGLYVAQNADKLASHFYEQGRADAIKQSAAKAKNIDMQPRQDAGSIVTPSGNKFRVVSGDSSNKLRMKMR